MRTHTSLLFLCLAVSCRGQEWIGPQQKFEPAPLNSDGTVADTPEIQKAKAVHLAAYHAELAHADPNWVEPEYPETPAYSPKQYFAPQQAPKQYFAPQPAPKQYFAPQPAPKQYFAPQPVSKPYFAPQAHSAPKVVQYSAPQHYSAGAKPLSAYQTEGFRTKFEPAPLNHDGTVADTPAIQQAKAIHLASYQEALARAPKPVFSAGHRFKRDLKHYEPAPLNHDGTVAETPEVKHAKAIHLAAYHEELAHADPHWKEPEYDHHHSYTPSHSSGHEHVESGNYHYAGHPSKHYPPAPLNKDGTVADTDEIRHAKHEFYSKYEKELSHADPHWVEPKSYDHPHY